MEHKEINTKKKLILTASDLIWQSSYGFVSVDHICKTAGLQKGSFYHYFKSKEDLAVAAIDHHHNLSKPLLDDIFSSDTPPIKRFEKLAEMILVMQIEALEKYGRVCGCPFATIGSEMAGQETLINNKIKDVFSCHLQYYEHALTDLAEDGRLHKDINIKKLAAKMQSFGMGQATMARIQNSLDPLKSELIDGWLLIMGAAHIKTANA